MKAIAGWKVIGWRSAALCLAATVPSMLLFLRPSLADEAIRKIDAEREKLLQRLRDVDDVQAKEQLRRRLLQKAWGAEPRQFEWDAVNRAQPEKTVQKPVKPAAKVRIQRLNMWMGQAQTLMVIADGNMHVIVEAVPLADEANDEDGLPPIPAQPKQKLRVDRGSSDQLLFGSGRDEAEARRLLFQRLWQKVAAVNRACGLTEAQSQKLELAGRGDIHRFFEQAAEMRTKFEAIEQVGVGDQGDLLKRVMAALEESRPLRDVFDSGPFGEGSLFAKSLRRMLTPEQAARYAGAGSSGEASK
jgi:hypothetical protein